MFREIWTALTGVPEPAARVDITGPPDVFASLFPVTQLATVSVVSSLAAAAGETDLSVDTRHVGAHCVVGGGGVALPEVMAGQDYVDAVGGVGVDVVGDVGRNAFDVDEVRLRQIRRRLQSRQRMTDHASQNGVELVW